MLMSSSHGLFISIGDETFGGEDECLMAELRRRMDHNAAIKTFRPRKIPKGYVPEDIVRRRLPDITPKDNRVSPEKSPKQSNYRRREGSNSTLLSPKQSNYRRREGSNSAIFASNATAPTVPPDDVRRKPNETDVSEVKANRRASGIGFQFDYETFSSYGERLPYERAQRHKMIDLTEQAIYTAQYRIKDLEYISRKYEETLEFRIQFIFKRLEQMEFDMEVLYTYLVKEAEKYTSYDTIVRVYDFLIHYEYILARHVDVTYLCERLMFMHGTNEGKRMEDEAKERGKQKRRPTLPANFTTPRFTGPMGLNDIIRVEQQRDRDQKLLIEKERNRPIISITRPRFYE